MKFKSILTCALVAVLGVSAVGFASAFALDGSLRTYTMENVAHLKNSILNRTEDDTVAEVGTSEESYDLNEDGSSDVVDLCIMKNDILSQDEEENTSKTLVAYYSASGTTDAIANYIAETLNADIFIITPVDEYTNEDLDWTNASSRVVLEHEDESRHVELVTTEVENWEEYDNVFIGYPIWWQEASWVVNDFVSDNDFTGKNVIPFCTSMSSPLGESGTKLAEMSGTGNWLEGKRFTSRTSQEEVQEWVSSLDLSKVETETTEPEDSNKLLVAYFTPADNDGVDAISSATVATYNGTDMGSAEVLANMIATNSGADLFSIQTNVAYPLEYEELADYAKSEQDNDVLPELTTTIENFDDYETVIVVFPVWWYTMPQAVYSFFDAYDFSGKTIIPATTHAGSGLAGSPKTISQLEPNATVVSNGFTVSASRVTTAESDVITWLDGLDLGLQD